MVNEEEAASHVLVAPLLPYGKPLYRPRGRRSAWRRPRAGLASWRGRDDGRVAVRSQPGGGRAVSEDTEIDLNLLPALGALLEDRNLTRAGERIGMSQPAMSAALARLRRHYGDDLLEREGRGYKRTVFGEHLLPTVREALRQLEATMQRSPHFDPAESDREFSIAASDYVIIVLADPLLRLVKQAAPRIRLNLHPLPAALPHASHVLSTDDLLIGPVGYDFPGRRVELFRDRFVCVV